MQKVGDGRAFAQEFGVRDHIEVLRVHAAAVQHAPYPLVGVDRHGAFFHDHFVTVDGACNLGDHSLDIGKVGGAGIALRRAHGDEDRLALLDGCAQVGREGDAAASVPGQHFRQMALEDGHAALAQGLYPGFVIVYADDPMSYLCKANGCNESHIAGPDYTDGSWLRHMFSLYCWWTPAGFV